jgi:hypothetical protein
MQFYNSSNRGDDRGRKRVPVIEVRRSSSSLSCGVQRGARRFEAVARPNWGIISRTEAAQLVQLVCDVRQ